MSQQHENYFRPIRMTILKERRREEEVWMERREREEGKGEERKKKSGLVDARVCGKREFES
jgi:hypothetical protein